MMTAPANADGVQWMKDRNVSTVNFELVVDEISTRLDRLSAVQSLTKVL